MDVVLHKGVFYKMNLKLMTVVSEKNSNKIVLKKLWHKGAYRMAMVFDKYDLAVKHAIKKNGVRISRTYNLTSHSPKHIIGH